MWRHAGDGTRAGQDRAEDSAPEWLSRAEDRTAGRLESLLRGDGRVISGVMWSEKTLTGPNAVRRPWMASSLKRLSVVHCEYDSGAY